MWRFENAYSGYFALLIIVVQKDKRRLLQMRDKKSWFKFLTQVMLMLLLYDLLHGVGDSLGTKERVFIRADRAYGVGHYSNPN